MIFMIIRRNYIKGAVALEGGSPFYFANAVVSSTQAESKVSYLLALRKEINLPRLPAWCLKRKGFSGDRGAFMLLASYIPEAPL